MAVRGLDVRETCSRHVSVGRSIASRPDQLESVKVGRTKETASSTHYEQPKSCIPRVIESGITVKIVPLSSACLARCLEAAHGKLCPVQASLGSQQAVHMNSDMHRLTEALSSGLEVQLDCAAAFHDDQ